MTASFVFNVFLVLLVGQTILQVALELLNQRSATKQVIDLPEQLQGIMTEDELERSVSYTRDKSNLNIVQMVCSSVVLILMVAGGVFGIIANWVEGLGYGLYCTGVLYILGLTFLSALFDAPFNLYSTFVLEERYGFNKTTLGQWFSDLAKGTLLSLFVMVPVLLGVFLFMDLSGPYWWLYVLAFLLLLQLVLLYIFPVWIAPIFNEFTPLDQGELRERIEALCRQAEFENNGVFSMDGSRRSAHGNAYFAGFGKNRRIVLFDTLIGLLQVEEIASVLCHEIGHAKHKHVVKAAIVSSFIMLAGLWIISELLWYAPLYIGLGFGPPELYKALVLFTIVFEPVGLLIAPMRSFLSRRHEFEADAYAGSLMGDARSLISALKKLSQKSLSNLTPHPLYSSFYYSHPTLVERINALERHMALPPIPKDRDQRE